MDRYVAFAHLAAQLHVCLACDLWSGKDTFCNSLLVHAITSILTKVVSLIRLQDVFVFTDKPAFLCRLLVQSI